MVGVAFAERIWMWTMYQRGMQSGGPLKQCLIMIWMRLPITAATHLQLMDTFFTSGHSHSTSNHYPPISPSHLRSFLHIACGESFRIRQIFWACVF